MSVGWCVCRVAGTQEVTLEENGRTARFSLIPVKTSWVKIVVASAYSHGILQGVNEISFEGSDGIAEFCNSPSSRGQDYIGCSGT